MPSATSGPVKPLPASSISGTLQLARAQRRSARLERMRRFTRPPVSRSTIGAMPSAIALMAFAPIASPQSMRRCRTIIG